MKLNDELISEFDGDDELSHSYLALQPLADQLKALAHPVRLQILQHLGNREKCCCNDFCTKIPLAQSTISQHLKILNKAGIIDYKPVGNCSNYSLNPNSLHKAVSALSMICELADKSSLDKLSVTLKTKSKDE